MIWHNGMTKFVGSSRLREGGRPVVHYQDFIAHTGATDWRHEASAIDMNPAVLNSSTVQSAIESIYNYVNGNGTGFISIGSLDGYSGFYATGKYNVNSVETPTLKDAIDAAVTDARLANGGIILLLPGYYRVSSTITIPNGISLIGEGPGVYIIGETSGGNSIFNISAITTDFSINGDSGSGDQNLILGTDVKKTLFKNLIITDNSDGYVNSGNATLSTWAMVLVDRGSNAEFEKVTFIGRLNDGPVLNRQKTLTAILALPAGLARGTSININKCYFDGLRNSVFFRPQLGSLDYLSIKNSKIKFYGEESTSYSTNDCGVLSSLANIEIENNFFLGAGAYSETLLGILSDVVSNPTDCSVKVVGNSGYTIGNISRLCDPAYTSPIRATMHGNAFSAGKDGNKPWTIVLGMDEGDILGEGSLDLILSTYDAALEVPTKIILNPGDYSLTVDSGTFSSLKLEGNSVGKKYPQIKLELTGATIDNLNNKYIIFGNNIKNIYFSSRAEFQSIHVSSAPSSNSDARGESIVVDNCIFKDTNLYVDTEGSTSGTNFTGALDGDATRMQAFISKCRFYQSALFDENWSLFLPEIDTLKLSDSYFHGTGYALLFGDVFSTGTSNTNFIIDSCVFDVAGITIDNLPLVSDPYYINLSSLTTKLNIKNSAFICSSDGNSVASIISSITDVNYFIKIRVSDLNIDSCYFNTPSDTYTDSLTYPTVGLGLLWVNSINLTNSVFNSGGLPIQIRINDTENTSTANQNYCNISNNKISLIDNNYITILDFDVDMDATDSTYRSVSVESNQFLSTADSGTGGLHAQHDAVTSSNYDAGGPIQVYVQGADVSFNNNYLVLGSKPFTSTPFTSHAGIIINTYDTDGKTSIINFNNNLVDANVQNIAPGTGSYYSSVSLKSNYINVNGNRINANNSGGLAATGTGFKGCLALDCRARSSAGDSIVSNNIFDRTSSAGALTTLYRGYVLVASTTDVRGQIIDNSFVSPYISGTTTTLVEDNTSTANNWIVARNKNQTQTIRVYGGYGQLGLKSTGYTFYSVAGLVNGVTTFSSDFVFRNSLSATNVVLNYRDTGDDLTALWTIPLKTVIPEGASIMEVSVGVDVSANPTTTSIATLSLINSGASVSDTSSPLTTSGDTLTVTAGVNDYIVQGSNPAYIEITLRIDSSTNIAATITDIEITYMF